ncbi:MAG: polyprenol monophosphomannose synthase [Bradymonadales bacterium]|nr:polyprenol monophosphomannose synthase [Bradymonadales bacterium]
MSTLIIMPTYNEKENLEAIIEAIHQVADDLHILVIDDGSPDGTGEIADRLAASEPRIFALHRSGKLGLGTAYITGFKWALERDYDQIFEMDADFSHNPSYLPAMRQALERYDMVVGSRYVPGGGTENWSWFRKLISRGGGFYSRLILGMKTRDLTAGFVAYRRATLQAIDLDAVSATGYGFQIEMKYRVHRQGLSIGEVPIFFEDRKRGTSKMSGAIFFEALLHVWKLRFKVGKGARPKQIEARP